MGEVCSKAFLFDDTAFIWYTHVWNLLLSEVPGLKDIAVIGGGASGLSFAVMVKEKLKSANVTVFEANDRVGRKLSITGNGRCNISNKNLSASRYHGDSALAERLLGLFGTQQTEKFFRSIGVIITDTGDDRLYPLSLQAASVTDALRFAALERGVLINTGCRVTSVKRQNGAFSVGCNGKEELFRTVVIACGGKAGGKLGGTDGYDILRSLGHKIEPLYPTITQLKTDGPVRQLKGIKTDAKVTLCLGDMSRTETGEVLFCDYGISGPPVLQLSGFAAQGSVISLDLCMKFSGEQVRAELEYRRKAFADRPLSELFTGFLNKKLGQVILKMSGADLNAPCRYLCDRALADTADTVKGMRLKVTGNTGFENAQATAGGASTAQFFDTMMSKKAPGLFAIGEVLNVDGDCGGFNLAFAWSSAAAAADGVTEFLKDKK